MSAFLRGAGTTPDLTPAPRRRNLRQIAREEAGLTLEEVVKRLPGKRWAILTRAQRKNRVSYMARIERGGTPCEKMARRLAALYKVSHFLFLVESRHQPGQNKRRHRTCSVSATNPAARTRRIHLIENANAANANAAEVAR